MSAVYRIQQGLRALSARYRPVDDALARQHLDPPLFALYRRMRRSERQHSLRVLRDLLQGGHTHPDLLVAGLLHDVGKTRTPFTLPEKVLVVLVRATAPRRIEQWGSAQRGSGSSRGWRRAFAVSVQHPAWGAEMVAEAGGSPLVVELIRRHQDTLDGPPQTEADQLLALLQAADNRN
ncbi:MAG: HD domain-containing protein [Anaerolineae bacterium]|nr:HD domain-containing protein [Anaerolineae bacterium]